MKKDMLNFINNSILNQAKRIDFIVKKDAPNNETDLNNSGQLVIWSGESHNTIFQDERVNFAFRAIHDFEHKKTGLLFTPDHEIELGRIQASKQSSQLLADLIYCEVSLQAKFFKENGIFVPDQVIFTKNNLKIA